MLFWLRKFFVLLAILLSVSGYFLVFLPTLTLEKSQVSPIVKQFTASQPTPISQLSFKKDSSYIHSIDSDSSRSAFSHITQLVFAGGGGRGFAYFPALKLAVENEGLDLTNVRAAAGTSAGAIAALMSLITEDLNELDNVFSQIPSKDFKDFSWLNFIFFVSEMGLYEGDELRNWLISNIFNHTGLIDPTFKELYLYNNKTLKVYGTNLTQAQLIEFSHQDTPDEKVIRAIQISCALPIAFKPRVNDQGDLLVDGGLIKNYPIDAFDYFDEHQTRYANPSTLGFYAKSAHEHHETQSTHKGVISYLQSIFDTVSHHESNTFSKADLSRTILIDCPKELSLSKMRLDKEHIGLIYKRCDSSLKRFLKTYIHHSQYPSRWAVNKGYSEVLSQICHCEKFHDYIDKDGNNLLMVAVLNQRLDIVKILLDRGVDICHQNKEGLTVADMSSKLYSNGIKSIINHSLGSQLVTAFDNKDLDRVRVLIGAGADLQYIPPGSNFSVLDRLVQKSDVKTLQDLYNSGARLPLSGRLISVTLLYSNFNTKLFLLTASFESLVDKAYLFLYGERPADHG